jgi:hypothetical protein
MGIIHNNPVINEIDLWVQISQLEPKKSPSQQLSVHEAAQNNYSMHAWNLSME